MTDILIATLGEAAPAISYGFQRWSEYRNAPELAIIHTDPEQSRIAAALARLRTFLPAKYPDLRIHWHEIHRTVNGKEFPMTDIDDGNAAWDYFSGVLSVLHEYREGGYRLHVLISGGRKAMAFYASTAAAALFRETGDQLWTIHSPEDLIKLGMMEIPAGRKAEIQLVSLPVLPARLSDEEFQSLATDPQAYFSSRMENRLRFLAALTPAERELADAFQENPYLEIVDISRRLSKAPKTIENQLGGLYEKMRRYVPEEPYAKGAQRLLLVDLLRGLLD